MDASQYFAPSLQGYVSYCINFLVRYFLIAGGLFFTLNVLGRRYFAGFRIQEQVPTLRQVGREIVWSISNTLVTGVSTVVLYALIRGGYNRMYFEVSDYGWPYFLVSIPIGILSYDAYFYWYHRLLHTRWLYVHAHSLHHRSSNPTGFAAFAHHPIETLFGNSFFFVFLFLVPCHPVALTVFGLYLSVLAFVGHCGFELLPAGFATHWLGRWWGTSTFHNMHHRHRGGAYNFGFFFTFWDRAMGTANPAYLETFESVTRRRLGWGHAPVGSNS